MTKIKNFFKRIFAFIKKVMKKIMNGIKNGYEYVRDELRDYSNRGIEKSTERYIANGMSEEEARAKALNKDRTGNIIVGSSGILGILGILIGFIFKG